MYARLLALSILLLAGCSTSGPVDPPAALVDFTPTATVTRQWIKMFSGSEAKEYRVLRPAINDSILYIGNSKGRLTALNTANGAKLWDVDTGKQLSGGVGLAGTSLLVGTKNAVVLAFNAKNGALQWEQPVSSEVLSPPREVNQTIVVHTVDGKIFGLSREDGKRNWVFESTVPSLSLRGTSTPAPFDGKAAVGLANGKVIALNGGSGKVEWEVAAATPRGRSELERIADVDVDPVITQQAIFIAAFQGRTLAIAPATGRQIWSRELSSSIGLAVAGNVVYVVDDNSRVWALDSRNGAALWKQEKLLNRRLTPPVVMGNYLVVGDFEGYLHWLNLEDGQIAARYFLDEAPITVAPVTAGDNLYAVSRGGIVESLRIQKRNTEVTAN